MTYAMAWPLQQAVHGALSASADLTALVGDRIYDGPPHDDGPDGGALPYVVIGDEEARAWGAADTQGAAHEITVAAQGAAPGFAALKQIGGIVSDVLTDAQLSLSRGRVVLGSFVSARTRRIGRAGERRVELRFRFVLED